jgi:aminomethyltransferase
MPLPTPFHPRTSELCTSLKWKEWAGYHAVCSYDVVHDPEYHAVRQTAGLLDVSPLHKVSVQGPDAAELLSWVTARDVRKLSVGRVTYVCWCDDDGRMLDDGTITRRDEHEYRVTTADPAYAWLMRHASGFDVQIDDVSTKLGALALQGPTSRAVLAEVADGGDVETLRFFGATRCKIAGIDVDVTRTGYTGDLGYELWIPARRSGRVWDTLMEAGRPHGLLPLGLDALDMLRVEAGFVLLGVDYFSARRCLLESQTSTPYELGLGWTVQLDRPPFLGQAALRREKQQGSVWALVGLVIDWEELEALYDAFGLPPHLPTSAWRSAVPVYRHGQQVGQATSGTWSPILKQNLALASVRTTHAAEGTELRIEVTVEYERRTVKAVVTRTPFFDPERKRT